jgi:WD40 repeat protein
MPARSPPVWVVIALALLLPLPCLALDPAWSAAGGGTVTLSADGSYLLSGGESFALYDGTGKAIWRGYGGSSAQAGTGIAAPQALTADGMYSIIGTNGGILYVDRSQRVFWEDSKYRPIDSIALSPDENFIASVADGQVSVYTRGGDLVWRNSTYSDVKTVGISREGLLTVAGSKDVIHAYNQTGFEIWNYTAPGIHGIRLSPVDSDIIAASDYSLIALHPSGNLLWKVYTGDDIRDFAISGDGSTIAAGNQGGRLVLVDKIGHELFSAGLGNWVNAVAVSGDGSLVAAGDINRKVHLYDRSGKQIFEYTTNGIVKGVALSADGSAMAAGSDMVYYFSLNKPQPAETTPAEQPPVNTAAPVTTAAEPAATAPAAGNTPENPPQPEVPVEQPPTTEAGSEGTAILAAGILCICSIANRRARGR